MRAGNIVRPASENNGKSSPCDDIDRNCRWLVRLPDWASGLTSDLASRASVTARSAGNAGPSASLLTFHPRGVVCGHALLHQPVRMSLLLISASLRSESRSRMLAQEAHRVLAADGLEATFLDLRDLPLPICDGDATYDHPNVGRASQLIEIADSILAATPVYNYDASAAMKNLVELTGEAWEDKVVGFLCAAGGDSSYMSIMSLANSLMLNLRCVIVPRFVYATDDAFAGGRLVDSAIAARVAQCARTTAKLAAAVKRSGG